MQDADAAIDYVLDIQSVWVQFLEGKSIASLQYAD
jgi:hypothetical protein